MATKRPRRPKQKPRIYVALRLLEEDFEALTALAEADRRPRGQYVEILVLDHIAEMKKAAEGGKRA